MTLPDLSQDTAFKLRGHSRFAAENQRSRSNSRGLRSLHHKISNNLISLNQKNPEKLWFLFYLGISKQQAEREERDPLLNWDGRILRSSPECWFSFIINIMEGDQINWKNLHVLPTTYLDCQPDQRSRLLYLQEARSARSSACAGLGSQRHQRWAHWLNWASLWRNTVYASSDRPRTWSQTDPRQDRRQEGLVLVRYNPIYK